MGIVGVEGPLPRIARRERVPRRLVVQEGVDREHIVAFGPLSCVSGPY